MSRDLNIERSEAPLRTAQMEANLALWRAAFGEVEYGLHEICAGAEAAYNRDLVYECRVEGVLAGTAHLTVSRADPALGGLGEVATHLDFRRRGIASKLCQLARDEFAAEGGRAVFLATGNPVAAQLYRRCGWLKLAGANVMALITSGESPEAFLVERFSERAEVEIAAGTPAQRIPMIPCIVSPHPWQVMDANTNILSTRHVTQCSCMGLYPRYARLAADGKGAWFAAVTTGGCLVGLASARFVEGGECQVDGFMHGDFSEHWSRLMQTPMEWAAARGAARCVARASVEDEDKIDGFVSLGFRNEGRGCAFEIGDRVVSSVRLVKGLLSP